MEIAGAILILVLLALAILQFFIPQFRTSDIHAFLQTFTGFIFSIGIAGGIVALNLCLILFVIAGGVGGNLRLLARSRFWLLFGVAAIAITALIWALFRLLRQF